MNSERYSDHVQLNSFTDFLIINELSKNSDGYKLSPYVHRDKDSKVGLSGFGTGVYSLHCDEIV